MTDDTGMLEHSLGAIPRRSEGYTTDDNARALWTVLEWLGYGAAVGVEDKETTQKLNRLVDTYLAFLVWAQRDDGSFHNNFYYDRRPEPETLSDDCQGRSLWAVALAYLLLPDTGRKVTAAHMIRRGLGAVERIQHPRGWAYASAACALLLAACRREGRRDPHLQAIAPELEKWTGLLQQRLLQLYDDNRSADWHWFEPVMTYGNGILPWSLLYTSQVTDSARAKEVGLESLDFLAKVMTAERGHIRPVGNQAWATRDAVSQWDQQPLEVMKLAVACAVAWNLTGREEYRSLVVRCHRWFLGDNDLGEAVADEHDGASCDGLTQQGVNRNQGAESTLAYLMTSAMHAHVVAQTQSYTLSAQPEVSAEKLLMA
jgi:hypothetical protein